MHREHMDVVVCLTGALKDKGDHIAAHKYFREPLPWNRRMCFAVCEEDDSTEPHVDAGCKEGGSDEQ